MGGGAKRFEGTDGREGRRKGVEGGEEEEEKRKVGKLTRGQLEPPPLPPPPLLLLLLLLLFPLFGPRAGLRLANSGTQTCFYTS